MWTLYHLTRHVFRNFTAYIVRNDGVSLGPWFYSAKNVIRESSDGVSIYVVHVDE
jgi:hypothetical protein